MNLQLSFCEWLALITPALGCTIISPICVGHRAGWRLRWEGWGLYRSGTDQVTPVEYGGFEQAQLGIYVQGC